MRVVSLLPSATEIVCALGLQDSLVGVSHSCDFPAGVEALPAMTSTGVPVEEPSGVIDAYVRRYLGDHRALYQLDLEALAAARPDVIVSQRLCDVCAVSSEEVDAALRRLPGAPVLIDLEPGTFDDVLDDIHRVGAATGRAEPGGQVVADLSRRVGAVQTASATIPRGERPRVAVIEWLDPPFDSGHWTPQLVELAGGVNCLGRRGQPSRTLSWDDVLNARPDVIVVSCCGFDIDRTRKELAALDGHDAWRTLVDNVGGKVWLTDGNAYLSRPGPRLVDALEGLAHTLNPAVHAAADDAAYYEAL